MTAFANGFAGACAAVALCLTVLMISASLDKINQLEYDLAACESLSAETSKHP